MTLKSGRNTTFSSPAVCSSWLTTDGDAGDQPDDQLGHPVAGRGLAAEDHRARHRRRGRAALQPVVERDQVEHVEVLALVLVEPLDLNVEERLPDRPATPVRSLHAARRARALLSRLDRLPLALERGVGGQRLETLAARARDRAIQPIADVAR